MRGSDANDFDSSDYLREIRTEVLHADKQWPQYDLLLEDLVELSQGSGRQVAGFERTLLYGQSLFAPLFKDDQYLSVDLSPASADRRGSYNKSKVPSLKSPGVTGRILRASVESIPLESANLDLIIVPNLVHHVMDQSMLWTQAHRVLKRTGLLYVFEPTFREIHQYPDDYLRYTPTGLSHVLEQSGFHVIWQRVTGGPFTAMLYCLHQALQYLTGDDRTYWENWMTEHSESLKDLDHRYPRNTVRSHTSFPTAFSLLARPV